MFIIFVFSTSNYRLWNKKKIENRVALKPKIPAFLIYSLRDILKNAGL